MCLACHSVSYSLLHTQHPDVSY